MASGYVNECLIIYLNGQEVHGSYKFFKGNNLIWFYYMLLQFPLDHNLLFQEIMSLA